MNKYVTEFIDTFFLILTVGGAVAALAFKGINPDDR